MDLEHKSGGGGKSMFFTLSIVFLIIPLILLVTHFLMSSKTKTDDVLGGIRCDELHYFVEDIKIDLTRATAVFGRRAAIYTLDDLVSKGKPFTNYTLNCTAYCGVDCSLFNYSGSDSEAALTELVLCGTLYGENVSYMLNHTLSEWIQKIYDEGLIMHFNTSLTVKSIEVVPYDAWNFSIIIGMKFKVADEQGMCFFEEDDISVRAYSNILGLEDPLYPLNTNAKMIKYIDNCSLELNLSNLAGISDRGYGNGTGGGTVIFADDLTDPDTYCTNHDVSGLVLVMTKGFGACNQIEQMCFNASADVGDHFEAVINEGPDDPQSFSEKCDVTIPWISDTDDLGLDLGACVFVRNIPSCSIYEVYANPNSAEIVSSCYRVSDNSFYGIGCGGFVDGPSFFDRLDGRYTLSEKYVNQSRSYFNNTKIGLETFVNPHQITALGIPVADDASWIDYLFWQNVTGCSIPRICPSASFNFNLDCPHTLAFGLDSSCANGSSPPPESFIVSPVEGSQLMCPAAPFIITVNATDCDSNISYVEVSADGGFTWANTTFNGELWTHSWTPTEDGPYQLTSRGVDETWSRETPTEVINVTVVNCP